MRSLGKVQTDKSHCFNLLRTLVVVVVTGSGKKNKRNSTST